jgi:TM2 domain-containing membrane protein YozV/RNA polymerase subunit RPABC4/transcription elongation factor Spt4
MKHCVNCGAEIDDEASVCPDCGVNQGTELDGSHGDRSADQKYCVNCGSLIYTQAELCPECGVTQPDGEGGATADTDQVVAGIFALLLGSFGIHKFYQGNVRNGVLYLCFFWTAIPGILAFVEGILMLVADEDEYAEKYADGSILGS